MLTPEMLEVSRKGREIYEKRLRLPLEKDHWGSFVSIEPASGDYFIGRTYNDSILAADAAYPDRVTYTLWIGHPNGIEIGSNLR